MRLEFKPQAFEDLQYWVQHQPKTAKRVMRMLKESMRDPFGGIGKHRLAASRPLASVSQGLQPGSSLHSSRNTACGTPSIVNAFSSRRMTWNPCLR